MSNTAVKRPMCLYKCKLAWYARLHHCHVLSCTPLIVGPVAAHSSSASVQLRIASASTVHMRTLCAFRGCSPKARHVALVLEAEARYRTILPYSSKGFLTRDVDLKPTQIRTILCGPQQDFK